ncbi:hypothetical protein GCM10020229_08990 [Kitasatospora albolonga]|uniref:right-handed parallel beta-helix repeat-containing protein n=1 Tax=Kitasatospora albolonga TaxID=68173 RepID=UPI0031E9623F
MSRRLRLLTAALAAALPLTLAVPAAAEAAPVTAYLDCSAATNGTGTQSSPYNTLAAVNSLTLTPGSALRLKRGSTCRGTLTPVGSGTAAAPVTVDAYGTGPLPAVNADGGTEAVLLADLAYVEVRNLDLSAPGDNRSTRRGVYVRATDTGTLPGIVLQGLDVHDVRGKLPAVTGAGAGTGKYADASGGIVVEAKGSTTPTAFTGLKILDNRIHAVDRQGIYTWSNWCRNTRLAAFWNSLCSAPWAPSTGLEIRGNRLWDIGGDGIAPMTGQQTLVERNLLQGFNVRSGSPNAGMWTANSVDVTFQYNDTSGGRTTSDGMAYDVDHSTDGVVFQYNYSHDNQGGFFLLCPYDTPTSNFTIRHNVSVNDRARGFQVCPGALKNGRIHHNTIYLADGISQQIVTEGTNATLDVRFTDNIVAKHGSSGTVGWTLNDPAFTIDHNVFYAVPTPAGATNTVTGAPLLSGRELADPWGYRLLAGSSALGAGGANTGWYQGPSVTAPTLAAHFNTDPAGSAPAGWTVTGPAAGAVVGADPGGGYGNSLLLTRQATEVNAVRTFPAVSGETRVDLRVRAGQTGAPLGVHLLDAAGAPVAQFSLAANGSAALTDNGSWTDAPFAYPPGVWLRVALLLHPATGTYDLLVDDVPLATARLTAGSGPADRLRLRVQPGTGAATFAVDDPLVQPLD